MTDRIHPASPIPPPANPATATAAARPPDAGARANPLPPAAKPHPYNIYRPRPAGVPYRPLRQPRRRCSGRRICCLCFTYTLFLLFSLILISAAAGAAFFFLYHPKRPTFSLSSLHIAAFNLSSPADPSAGFSHLRAALNFTLFAKNPNSDITFLYDPFSVAVAASGLFIGGATIPAFTHLPGNTTIARATVLSDPKHDLDPDSIRPLNSDLEKNRLFPITVQVDTKVRAKIGKLGTRRVGVRVTCTGIRGALPEKKGAGGKTTPAVGSTANAKCQVDPMIRIWKFTF